MQVVFRFLRRNEPGVRSDLNLQGGHPDSYADKAALLPCHRLRHNISDRSLGQWLEYSCIDRCVLNGLSDPIKDCLAPLELPQDLETLISMATRVYNRLREREREGRRATPRPPSHQGRFPGNSSSWNPPVSATPGTAPPQAREEPMQLGRTRISPEERQHRLQEASCFYCGRRGHQHAACPGKGQAHRL